MKYLRRTGVRNAYQLSQVIVDYILITNFDALIIIYS